MLSDQLTYPASLFEATTPYQYQPNCSFAMSKFSRIPVCLAWLDATGICGPSNSVCSSSILVEILED